MSRSLIRAALTDDLQTAKEIGEKAGMSKYGVKKYLGSLMESREAIKVVTSEGRVFYKRGPAYDG